LEENTLQHNST